MMPIIEFLNKFSNRQKTLIAKSCRVEKGKGKMAGYDRYDNGVWIDIDLGDPELSGIFAFDKDKIVNVGFLIPKKKDFILPPKLGNNLFSCLFHKDVLLDILANVKYVKSDNYWKGIFFGKLGTDVMVMALDEKKAYVKEFQPLELQGTDCTELIGMKDWVLLKNFLKAIDEKVMVMVYKDFIVMEGGNGLKITFCSNRVPHWIYQRDKNQYKYIIVEKAIFENGEVLFFEIADDNVFVRIDDMTLKLPYQVNSVGAGGFWVAPYRDDTENSKKVKMDGNVFRELLGALGNDAFLIGVLQNTAPIHISAYRG